MKRRIISILLLSLVMVLSVSCENDKASILNKTIVVSSSDPGHMAAARDYASSNGSDYVEYYSSSDAVVAVLNGKADYVVLDEYSGYTFVKENAELVLSEKCEYKIENRACFSLENDELCQKFNETFAALKKDGTIDKIKSLVYEDKEYIPTKQTGENGEIVMVCDPVFEKRVYIDDGGEVSGVDVYIAKEVCSRLGYRLIIKTRSYEDLYASLDDGEADFIMSCVERTDEKAEQYLFSDVYVTYNYNAYKLK